LHAGPVGPILLERLIGLRFRGPLRSPHSAAFFFHLDICAAQKGVAVVHIQYIDDSGSVDNPNDRYFVLGGISIFERGLFHQVKQVDDCVSNFALGYSHDIELHASRSRDLTAV
jgi:hypothetical protein